MSKSQIKSLHTLLGTSGVGKGSRVSQLLTFLETKFENHPIYFIVKEKQRQHGLYFPEIDVYFIGTWTISNKSGLKSWTSLDYINSATGKTEITCQRTKDTARGHVIMEGEPMLLSNRYRPIYMNEMYGVTDFSFTIFDYATREEYDERILGRSGKIAGEGGWSRNSSYAKQPEKMEAECKELEAQGLDIKRVITKHNFDADITIFGEIFLKFIGKEDLIQEFLEYSKTTNTLRNVKDLESEKTLLEDWDF